MMSLVDLERQNIRHAMDDPAIDKAELLITAMKIESARRRQLQLSALPEPSASEIRMANFLAAIGR